MNGRVAVVLFCFAAGGAGFALYHYGFNNGAAPAAVQDIRFTDLDGRPHALAEYGGRFLLVNFWGTWCAPCLEEIPLLAEAQKKYGARGLQVLGPAMDNADAVRGYRDKAQLPYPVFAGGADVAKAMDALGDTLGGLPFSVLISPAGEILHRQSGEFSEQELNQLIEKHLAN